MGNKSFSVLLFFALLILGGCSSLNFQAVLGKGQKLQKVQVGEISLFDSADENGEASKKSYSFILHQVPLEKDKLEIFFHLKGVKKPAVFELLRKRDYKLKLQELPQLIWIIMP